MAGDRILLRALRDKVMPAEEAASLIKPNMTIGASGFTATGYPKAIPRAVAAQKTATGLSVITGASCGDALDGELARAGLVAFRTPFNVAPDMRRCINEGKTRYVDMHLGRLPQAVRNGIFGRLDYAIIECCMITEDGGIVPTLSVGASNTLMEYSDYVILEINLSSPPQLYGMHDIYRPRSGELIPLANCGDRIGNAAAFCNPEKIAAIVITDEQDQQPRFLPPDDISMNIAGHMVDVLRAELSAGRIPRDFTFQSGFGSVGNAVLGNLSSSEFGTLNMYTEVAQDAALSLVLEGRIRAVSATSLLLSAKGRNCLYENLPCLRKRVVLRPQDVTNDAGMIHRMGVIAMNTALEVDIYGNVNSTHVMGSGMMNGIGGSGDFARNSALAVFITPSVAKEGTISSIVPMVSHVDHTEHDVHIVVTEQGVADLRGKSPTERARLIIENCAHPDYRAALRDYCEQANRDASARHTPHSLDKALSWHQRYLDKKHMLL